MNSKLRFKQDKAVAGLTILLSVIVFLFVIGLLVMIFSLMGAGILDSDSIYTRTGTNTVGLETIALATTGTTPTTVSGLRTPHCTFVAIYNGTTILGAGNVTELTECSFANTSSGWSTYRINYTYTFLNDLGGTGDAINDTVVAITDVIDWFDIFIVITAMVVLIILTVMIITAIRGSGMVDGLGNKGANSVGTA